jgi:hypothetical protein
MDKMSSNLTPEMRKSIWKWAFTWMAIMLSVNFLYVGYVVSSTIDYSTTTESTLYNQIMSLQGTMNTNINKINNTASGYSQNDITDTNEGIVSYIWDKIDAISNYVKFVGFAIELFAFGGLVITWDILTGDLVDSLFIKMAITIFMGFTNIVFILLMSRFVLNKLKED